MVARTTTIDPRRPFPARTRGVAISEVLAVVALCAFVSISALVIGPRLLRGAPRLGSTKPAQPRLAAQQEVLEALLAQASEVLSIRFGEGDSMQLDTLVLWLSDDRYPGQANLSELLVLRFSPVLRTIIAYTWAPPPDEDRTVSLRDLRETRSIDVLTSQEHTVRAVIAQSVIACEVTGIKSAQSIRPDSSSGPISLRLTWFEESTDSRDVSTVQTQLRLNAHSGGF